MRHNPSLRVLAAALLLLSLANALPHGDEEPQDMEMGGGMDMSQKDTMSKPLGDWEPSYWSLREYTGSLIAHVACEVIAWCFVLPIGKIFRPSRIVFLWTVS